MAKLSAINKNNRRIKLSNKFFNKRSKLKKIIMDKKIPLEERLKHNKNFQNYQEIQQKVECVIDARFLVDPMEFIES